MQLAAKLLRTRGCGERTYHYHYHYYHYHYHYHYHYYYYYQYFPPGAGDRELGTWVYRCLFFFSFLLREILTRRRRHN